MIDLIQIDTIGGRAEQQKQSPQRQDSYSENIKQSEQLRRKINLDIQQGKELYKILLDALQCISLMAGEPEFFESNKRQLQAQALALGEPSAISIEVEAIESRVVRMKAYLEGVICTDERQRVRTAIQRHEKRKEAIIKLTPGSKNRFTYGNMGPAGG